jgi:hypothetical protein
MQLLESSWMDFIMLSGLLDALVDTHSTIHVIETSKG